MRRRCCRYRATVARSLLQVGDPPPVAGDGCLERWSGAGRGGGDGLVDRDGGGGRGELAGGGRGAAGGQGQGEHGGEGVPGAGGLGRRHRVGVGAIGRRAPFEQQGSLAVEGDRGHVSVQKRRDPLSVPLELVDPVAGAGGLVEPERPDGLLVVRFDRGRAHASVGGQVLGIDDQDLGRGGLEAAQGGDQAGPHRAGGVVGDQDGVVGRERIGEVVGQAPRGAASQWCLVALIQADQELAVGHHPSFQQGGSGGLDD